MKIDTAGTYTLRYTAEDECGNDTTADRTLIVASIRTVLYADGTFIINELPRDRATNEALHGVATNEYIPFDPDGDTLVKKYRFSYPGARPWNTEAALIQSVEIGSVIQPSRTQFWFAAFSNCTSIDLSNLDTSVVDSMVSMFNGCNSLTTLDLSSFHTSNATQMNSMFNGCNSLTTLDVSNFNTDNVSDMSNMFNGCNSLTTLDLSSFDTSSVVRVSNMFNSANSLTTIYVSQSFTLTSAMVSTSMFGNMSTNLVGGSGTVWSASNPTDKTYARIDNPPNAPGYFTQKPAA